MTTQSAPPELTDGFHLFVDALKLNGIDTIYGLVGIPITDLARLAQKSGIRFIGFRHETSAGNAAAAAGFLTRRPGVCLTVSGPGFLNGLVALANATTNCFPMIQIAGSSERPIVDMQRGDYEELDQLAAARPFAKAAYRIGRVEDIGAGCRPRHSHRGLRDGPAASTWTSRAPCSRRPSKPTRPPTPSGGSSTPTQLNYRRLRRSTVLCGCWPRRNGR